jgi:hypothetical protein
MRPSLLKLPDGQERCYGTPTYAVKGRGHVHFLTTEQASEIDSALVRTGARYERGRLEGKNEALLVLACTFGCGAELKMTA